MMQVSELLYLVLREAESAGPATQLASAVSAASGRGLSPEILEHLARSKLEPMGLLRDTTAGVADNARVQKANPLLRLRLKGTLVPAAVVRPLARALTFLYWGPIVVAALAGLVVLDVMVLRHGDPMTALSQILTTPTFLLLFLGLLVSGALIHEFGHAVGCRAGGAEPGAIGVGVYLFFPAFYTDVTQSYRLGRSGRLRTDLGGLYFNVWCLLVAGTGYLITGQPVLLMVLVFMHLEMVQQLVPTVRFDGYFVLADLAGVPDLFARVHPVLSSLRPGRPLDPRVAELRPAARRIITVWVLLVVPVLVGGLVWIVWNLPAIVSSTVSAIQDQTQLAVTGWSAGDIPSVAFAVLSSLLLAIPIIGFVAILPRLVMSPFQLWAARRARRAAQAAQARDVVPASPRPRHRRVNQRPAGTEADRLRDPDGITNYAQLPADTAQSVASHLQVWGCDDDPRTSTAPGRGDYHRVLSQLDRLYNLILIDTVTGFLDRANDGVADEADQLVLVLKPVLHGGPVGALTLDWLDEQGYHDLVAGSAVVDTTERRRRMTLGPRVRHIAIESGAFVVSVPQYIPGSAFPEDFPVPVEHGVVYGRGGAVIVEPTEGEVIAGPLYDREGILGADCDLRVGLHAKRWFDAVGHYSREDVLLGLNRPGAPRPRAPERQQLGADGRE
jgi:hypothetical protein